MDQAKNRLEPPHDTNPSPRATVPEAIALDMDGLLFDTERIYWQVGDTILQRRGYRYSAELQQRMMGRIGTCAVEQMIEFHSLSDSPESLLAESDELYGDLLAEHLRPMPGLEKWIRALMDSGIPFALTTSSRRRWVDEIFCDVSWRDAFAFTLTGDDVSRGKPHPEMYLTAAEKFGVAPSQMLVLEDSGNGVAASVAAGAMTVAIPSEHTRSQNFDGAILIADSLTDPRLWELVGASETR